MAKTHRVSVPLTPEMERKLKKISAENGRSVASNFAELAQAGAQKSAVDQELSALRSALKTEQPSTENVIEALAQLRIELRDFITKQAAAPASFSEQKECRSGLFLPEKAARMLFGEALFSSVLASEILQAELPGAPPKPATQHLRNARQKSNAALENFLKDAGLKND